MQSNLQVRKHNWRNDKNKVSRILLIYNANIWEVVYHKLKDCLKTSWHAVSRQLCCLLKAKLGAMLELPLLPPLYFPLLPSCWYKLNWKLILICLINRHWRTKTSVCCAQLIQTHKHTGAWYFPALYPCCLTPSDTGHVVFAQIMSLLF